MTGEIAKKCASFGDDTLLRIELSGITSESFSPDEDMLKLVIPAVSYLEIKDLTQPLLNISKLKIPFVFNGNFRRFQNVFRIIRKHAKVRDNIL